MAVDDFGGSTVPFAGLPKEMQDTILSLTDNPGSYFTNCVDSVKYGDGIPLVISFDEPYTLENVKFGPWVKYRILIRVSDGKEYKLTRNAPTPILVRNDSLLIPTKYNIITVWDSSIPFKVYKLR